MALGLCRRELVDRSTELGRPTTKAPIYGLGLQAEFRRELTSLFLSRSEQLIHSSSLAFPTTKDCTLKLSKDKPFLGLHCTQMFSPQQRKFLDNPLLSPPCSFLSFFSPSHGTSSGLFDLFFYLWTRCSEHLDDSLSNCGSSNQRIPTIYSMFSCLLLVDTFIKIDLTAKPALHFPQLHLSPCYYFYQQNQTHLSCSSCIFLYGFIHF